MLPPSLPDSMRAIAIDATGEPDVLRLRDLPLPAQIQSEVIVRVMAAGVNPIDAKTRAGGGVSAAIPGFPSVLGQDFSGVVVATPYEAYGLKAGDEVFGMVPFPRYGGTYAEYVSASTLHVAKKPATLSHVEAAACPTAALTAWGMVVAIAKAHEGQRMLIHAGSGGVGHFAVQIAAYFGAHVIATGSTRNLSWLKELGAREVVDHTVDRFDEIVDPVDVVIDLIGNVHDHTGSRSLQVLRPGGLLVNAPTGSWPTMLAEAEEVHVRATTYKVAPDGATLAVLARLLESGDVKVFVDTVFDLADAADAHRAVEQGHTRGKLVLSVSSDG
jgi:NADPH:quinone reductase-like Zn-dependent oxidoreductase